MLTKDDADEAEAMPKRKRGPVGAVAPPIVDLDAAGHAPYDGVAGDPLDDVAGDSGSDEVAAAPPPVVVAPGPLEDLPVDHVPAEICGALVKILPGHVAKGYHRRIQVKCNVEGHAGCNTKSRSLNLATDQWGPRAAEFFIGAWLTAGAGMSSEEHKVYKPTDAQIAAYAASL